jgi:hypothetical protein
MDLATLAITIIYWGLVAFASSLMIWNLLRTRNWEKEVLYLVVLLPFLLRLFWLK